VSTSDDVPDRFGASQHRENNEKKVKVDLEALGRDFLAGWQWYLYSETGSQILRNLCDFLRVAIANARVVSQ
jgi:hypothetical protein